MTPRYLFSHPNAPEVKRLREWHQNLLLQPNRGERARLRRASSPEEAALAPAYHELLRRIGPQDLKPAQMAGLAALAVVAAGVDLDLPQHHLGKSLGSKPGSQQAPVSEARFRRLLTSDDLEARFDVLRRLVALLGKSADLVELGGALLDWNANRRRQLAYDYYSTANLSVATSEEKTS